jgi:inositol transport system permease protein
MENMVAKRFRDFREIFSKYSLFIILIVFMTVCSFANSSFLSVENLINVLRQQSVIIIIAIGEMVLIIGGMLDLSAGSVIAAAGILSVSVYKFTGNLALAIIIAIGIAVLCNFLNGLMVTLWRTPPFIATLAMQAIARGFALFYTNGQNIYDIGNYSIVGQGVLLGVPIPVIIMIIVALALYYIMTHTRFGRSVYAVGGNEEAANASGISVNWVKMRSFLLHGCLVGIAAVIFMSRVNGGLPNGAQNYEFDALTAAIIGGTSFSGGIGTVVGTIIGAFIVGFLNNIMDLMSINSYIQQMVRGAIIAGAVIWDIYSKGKQSFKKGGK